MFNSEFCRKLFNFPKFCSLFPSRSNAEKSLTSKKRIIKMLFVVVLEFFICWTPLYVINTIALFDKKLIYKNLGYTAISFFQLLAYSSSCCNPITYCFMNCGFRKAFLNLFRCLKTYQDPNASIGYSTGTLGVCGGGQLISTTLNSVRIKNYNNNNNVTNRSTNFLEDCKEESSLFEQPSRQQSFTQLNSQVREFEGMENNSWFN